MKKIIYLSLFTLLFTSCSSQNVATKKTLIYHLVSENEADIKLGKISVTSPIGKGLLGKEVGEIADIQVPSGVMKFKIEEITV